MELGTLKFPAATPGGMCSAFAVLVELSHKGDRDGWHPVVGQDRSTGNGKKDETQREASSKISLPLTKARNKNQKLTKDLKDRSSLCFNIYKEEPQRLPRIRPWAVGKKRAETERPQWIQIPSRLRIGGFAVNQSPRRHRPRAWRARRSLL